MPLRPRRRTRTVVRTVEVDDDGLAAHLAPRHDLLVEADGAADEDGVVRFAQERGPFLTYERRVEVVPLADGRHRVTQTTDFDVEIGGWYVFFGFPLRAGLRRAGGEPPWWAPPEPLDVAGMASIASLGFLSLVAGYTGTLITQTLTFAADEFGAGEQAQGDTLAAVRIGVLVALVVAAWADRNGRRRALLWCASACVVVTSLGALAPGLLVLASTQVVARGLSTALALLIVVVAAEEMPAGSRAYGVSLLTMAAGLGAGQVLWLLPIVDIGPSWWRALYVVPLAYLPLIA